MKVAWSEATAHLAVQSVQALKNLTVDADCAQGFKHSQYGVQLLQGGKVMAPF